MASALCILRVRDLPATSAAHHTSREKTWGARSDALVASRGRAGVKCNGRAASRPGEGGGRRLPCVILPGFLFGAEMYTEMGRNLERLGHQVYIVPVKSSDWMGSVMGGDFTFYLRKAQQTVLEARAACGPVALVGHSAGGWLARILMGSAPYAGRCYGLGTGPDPAVRTLVTLGTPHSTIEAYPFGRFPENRPMEPVSTPVSVQRSSIQFANHHYPNAESFPGVRIRCYIGSTCRGEPLGIGSFFRKDLAGLKMTYESWLWYQSYAANSGQGAVYGDGICPVNIAGIPGAWLVEMPNVVHTPKVAQGLGLPWYGDMEVVRQWHTSLLLD